MRRYTSPEEAAFFPDRLPDGPVENLPKLEYPDILEAEASKVNFNNILLQKYINAIVPSLTTFGDDEQHGSCTLCDIAALQALSRRVHYGKFVAESKYRGDPEGYQRLVDANDADGVMALLTHRYRSCGCSICSCRCSRGNGWEETARKGGSSSN